MIPILALVAFAAVAYLCGSIDRDMREDDRRG